MSSKTMGGIGVYLSNLKGKMHANDALGDVFFARGALVFDGVFELAPHPMYSVGKDVLFLT